MAEQRAVCRLKQRFRSEKNHCYGNSQRALLLGDTLGLEYAEGYAVFKDAPGFPVRHAWLLLNGKVVDVTSGGNGHDYFGITIPRKTVMQFVLENRGYGPLTDDWHLGWKYTHLLLGWPAAYST